MRRKCRIWWPKQLFDTNPSSFRSMVLFGWFLCPSRASLDIVVAFAVDEVSFSGFGPNLQGILLETDRKMPLFLKDKSMFSILGHCIVDFSINCQVQVDGEREDCSKTSVCGNIHAEKYQHMSQPNHERWNCGCQGLHGFLEQCKRDSGRMCNWIQLLCNSQDFFVRDSHLLPQLHHMHFDGEIESDCDVHIIIYESPTYGGHHFSLSSFSSSEQVKSPLKKPKWFDELQKKQQFLDLETTILAINSVTAAKRIFLTQVGLERFGSRFPFIHLFTSFMKQLLALFISSFFALFYIILQMIHCILSYGSNSWVYHTLAKLFSHTWKNFHIRCCQILYWPILLQGNSLRFQSCVEYAEKAALRKHFLWSNIAADILLGNFVGLALLISAESTCIWVLNYASDIRNNLLRTGCVWLMGVPAGFKLNTELAGILGMISLNIIQIWSTFSFFVGFFLIYFIKGIAISGMVFGFTIPAALTIDTIRLSALHVSTIHWLLSVLYSVQIQALAALWRLFRGRKWNPLRKRFDSYDYSVEQHVVGSLLFSPLLLLLPTTSVFYIFFSILESTISLICIMIEVTISMVHATPYIKILFWLLRQGRFPYGIWFENLPCQRDAIGSPESVYGSEISSSANLWQKKIVSRNRSTILLSVLHSNFLTIGQILSPCYENVFSGVSCSLIASSAYGVLFGKRFPSSLGTALPKAMPWMSVDYKDYWHLCYDSIIACMTEHD
ncbi:Phosphatidylinositol N-acetylglucosaminyltransferase subunit Q/GPI1 [Dillenia turbinata]|uniref:Phosphatidylinositol N-acetylglucosaminyltransferase subunit Q/GPI1 n=1 Tax=Dillenia turbinata TaxID=194707 RepID=A0AAN8ZPT4_9MAGN